MEAIVRAFYRPQPLSDSLQWWGEQYLLVGLLRSPESLSHARLIRRFIDFLVFHCGSDARTDWTSRASQAFLQALRQQDTPPGSIRNAGRVLRAFAQWIQLALPAEKDWTPIDATSVAE